MTKLAGTPTSKPWTTSDDIIRDSAARIAVLIPCHNEETLVGTVVRDLSTAVPEADIYVYDNDSSDRTIVAARALVCHESMQGKGYVVFRMFSEIDADVYLLIDGGATYDTGCAPAMIERLIKDQLDMICPLG